MEFPVFHIETVFNWMKFYIKLTDFRSRCILSFGPSDCHGLPPTSHFWSQCLCGFTWPILDEFRKFLRSRCILSFGPSDYHGLPPTSHFLSKCLSGFTWTHFDQVLKIFEKLVYFVFWTHRLPRITTNFSFFVKMP